MINAISDHGLLFIFINNKIDFSTMKTTKCFCSVLLHENIFFTLKYDKPTRLG